MVEISKGLVLSLTVLVIVPFILVSLAKRAAKEKGETGRIHHVKKIIITVFIVHLTGGIVSLLATTGISPEILMRLTTQGVSVYGILTGLNSTIGLYLVFFLFDAKKVLYFPFYFYGFLVVYYFFTGWYFLIHIFLNVGSVFTIVMLFIVAIRIKDNNAMGLALFLSVAAFATLTMPYELLPYSIDVFLTVGAYALVGFMLTTGKIKIFKDSRPREEFVLSTASGSALEVQAACMEANDE